MSHLELLDLFRRSLLALLAVAAFLLPGWLVVRWVRAPFAVLTAFLGSCVLWFHVVVAADALGIPIRAGPMLTIWITVAALLAFLARRAPAAARTESGRWRPRGSEWLWFGCACCALGSIGVRAFIDPLSGWDNAFRWDNLAHQIVDRGSLQFYPPVAPADFEIYPWSDGIPPLVSLLNAWIYLVTGERAAEIIAVRIMGEALLVGGGIFAVAQALWEKHGGWPAIGLGATSALLVWSVAQSQELGILTISTLTLVACLLRAQTAPGWSCVAWAGVAAGVGALGREYMLVLPIVGTVIVAASGSTRRFALGFLLPAMLIPATWYLRNLALTGNPLYPQTLGGLFPGNPFFDHTMQGVSAYWRFSGPNIRIAVLALTIAALAGLVIVFAALGMWFGRRRVAAPIVVIAAIGVLWSWSVPMTAGGLNYSLRVLAPAVAVLAALGGAVGLLPRGWRIGCASAALLFSADAARRAWMLPVEPRTSPWPYTWSTWRDVRSLIARGQTDPLWNQLVDRAAGRTIGVDSPDAHVETTRRGGRVAMLFSPIFQPCFDSTLTFDQVVARLRAAEVGLLLVHSGDPIALRNIRKNSFLRMLVELHAPALTGPGCAVYDLAALQPKAP